MGLKKSEQIKRDEIVFENLDEVKSFFQKQANFEQKYYALEKSLNFEGGAQYLVSLLSIEKDNKLLSSIGTFLANINPKIAPIESILEYLKSDNAFVRNLVISILQDYGEEIKYYIVKYLISEDKDLRIFAINVLGDVNFAESKDMLVELLESERDLNVAMTAVDYLSEIGEESDIGLLLKLKERFENEPYVEFAIENAIKSIRG